MYSSCVFFFLSFVFSFIAFSQGHYFCSKLFFIKVHPLKMCSNDETRVFFNLWNINIDSVKITEVCRSASQLYSLFVYSLFSVDFCFEFWLWSSIFWYYKFIYHNLSPIWRLKCWKVFLVWSLKKLTVLIWNHIGIGFITIGWFLITYQLMMSRIIVHARTIVNHWRWNTTRWYRYDSCVLLCWF